VDATEELLKTLTEAHGVPGYEDEIRGVVRQYLDPLGTISQDKLGSLICHQPADGPKVMLAGHMDEIGFMILHITKEGYLKFVQLGGWWDQVLLGHRVLIRTHKGNLTGVIGAKPPHIMDDDESKKVVQKKDMYIDIGATSEKEVEEAGVRIGDPVIPKADFEVLANSKTFLSKAFDDRLGCAWVIDTLRYFVDRPHPNHIYGVATVMEEVGLRGATTSVHAIDPDVAIILEVDIAGDIPGVKPEQSRVKIGQPLKRIYPFKSHRIQWVVRLMVQKSICMGLAFQPSFLAFQPATFTVMVVSYTETIMRMALSCLRRLSPGWMAIR
jgi:endoglucanase